MNELTNLPIEFNENEELCQNHLNSFLFKLAPR